MLFFHEKYVQTIKIGSYYDMTETLYELKSIELYNLIVHFKISIE